MCTRAVTVVVVMSIAGGGTVHAGENLLFHAAFEGTVKADTAHGSNVPVRQPTTPVFVDGVRGQAILLHKEVLWYEKQHNINLPAGTVMFWMKPVGWDPTRRTATYEWTFAVAGSGAEGDRLQFFKYPHPMLVFYMGKEGKVKALPNSIRDWKRNQWRFFALVWDATSMKLFIDGERAGKARIGAEQIAVRTGPVMRLQSSQQACAFDELCIFGRPLLDEEVRRHYLKDRPDGGAPDGAGELRPLTVVPQVAPPPRIDGRADRGEWDATALIGGFLDIPELLHTSRPTQVRLAYDHQNLYALVISPIPDKPKAEALVRDGKVYGDESFEVLLAGSPSGQAPVWHMIANVRDVHYDARAGQKGWNPRWVSRSGVHDGRWTAEVRIPFAELGVAAPKPGDRWRFNVGRNFKRPDKFANPVFALAYAQLEAFGELHFGDKDEYAAVRPLIAPRDRLVGASGHVQSRAGSRCRVRVDLKKVARAVTDRRRLRCFDTIHGTTVLRKEHAGVVTPSSPFTFEVREPVDQPGMYYLRCRAFAGQKLLYRQIIPFRFQKRFSVELEPQSKDDRLVVRWELNARVRTPARVAAELRDGSGKTLQNQGQSLSDRARGTLAFDMKPLGQLHYTVVTTVSGSGHSFAQTTPFTCFKNADWIGFAKRLTDRHVVPKPWVPLRTGQDTVRTLLHEYRLGDWLLPARVDVETQPILAGPVALDIRTAAGHIQPDSARRLVERHDDRLVFRQTGAGPDAELETQAAFEFDGMVRYDVRLKPKRSTARLKRLVLEIPLDPKFATLKYPYRGYLQKWSVLDLEGEVTDYYKDYFLPHIWVGNDEKGIAWFAESDEPYAVSAPDKVIELVREADRVVLRITMVDRPKEIHGPVTFTFGMMATPSRPLPRHWFALRFASCISTPNMHLTTGYSTGAAYHVKPGFPYPAIDPDRAKRWVRGVHGRPGRAALVYATSNGAGGNVPEFRFFEQEWKDPLVCDTWSYATRGFYHWGTCPTVDTLRDFFLYTCAKAIDEYGIDGLYYDYGTVFRADNPAAGCGYARNGKRRPTYPIFADRELRKMAYVLFMQKKGKAHFILHNYSQMVAPIASFMTVHLDGESYQQRTGKVGATVSIDYTRLIPLPRFRAMFGTQFGTVPYFLPALPKAEDKAVQRRLRQATRTLIAMALPHGVPIWGFYCDIPELNRYVAAQDRFGFESSTFVPYYRLEGGIRTEGASRLLVSYWKKPGDLLIVVSNLETAAYSGTLIVDTAKIFGPGVRPAGVVDACTQRALDVKGDRVTIAVSPKDYLLLRVRTAGGKP